MQMYKSHKKRIIGKKSEKSDKIPIFTQVLPLYITTYVGSVYAMFFGRCTGKRFHTQDVHIKAV